MNKSINTINTASESKLWFKRKSFGWGWTPVSWQGWAVLALYFLGLIKFFRESDLTSHSGSDFLINFAVPFTMLTIFLIIICYIKGEKPKWQWGNLDK